MKPLALNLQNLTFSYGSQTILQNVTVTIEQGEFIGIFGPNGGGKTTLLKLLMGFLTPTEGTIEVFDRSPEEARPKIGYVPQRLQFDPQFPLSVQELILSGRLSHLPWYGRYLPEDIKRCEEMIERMELGHVKHHAFGTLSGGQAQRALIARALISNPELLLLDEPTAGVDSQAEQDIYQILEELKGSMTILMVTHHLRTAIEQVGRVLLVRKKVVSLLPGEVCEHYAMGLYHPPLIQS